MNRVNKLRDLYWQMGQWLNKFIEPIALFLLRLTVAKVFLNSGLTKWDGFLKFNTEKYDLFMYEFFCPDPVRPGALLLCDKDTLDYADGAAVVPFIKTLAVSAGIMEVTLSLLLIFGLFTRFAALGLLGMTLFIQFAIFPTWDHWINPASWWAITLFVIFARGPGLASIDRLLKIDAISHRL